MQFDQFSAQSFEQLIQALTIHRFGSGATIFGPGRDGGREATFRGALPTFENSGWNGYTVVQAKCKERPLNDTRDASWLCGQLRGEFQKFIDNPDLERPEYYLLCTNVQLSAVPKVGGKQQIEDVFEEFKSALGLKGWHVWSADELRALLADAPSIRQTFASWITPGDVLFELIEKLAGPDLKQALPLILSSELRTDRDARLRDAGQETEQAVYLEDVFIDLPIDLPNDAVFLHFEEHFIAPDKENLGDEDIQIVELTEEDIFDDDTDVSLDHLTPGCVASLFEVAADRLDPVSMEDRRRSKRSPFPNRVVILGGPGQGKSTLGQFVVQVSRARLLSTLDRRSLNPQTIGAIEKILSAAQQLKIPLYGPTRIPVRVDLPAFADAVTKGNDSGKSILNFVGKRFADISGHTVTVPAMRKLLQEFPLIVIFDGLDEVPPSSNRQDVIKAIEAFWDDVCHVGGDVLSVVTSRPQGYDNDLSQNIWQHWTLLPLNPKHAASYADKLGNVRVSEPERRASILADIERACSDPSTTLLTTSPLQVTILFGISFLKGSIPQDRWELFDRYYNLLRDREAQKPGADAKFIRDNKRIIDDLHQTCGWILQAEAEARGRTVSYLTDVQFKNVIAGLLDDEGHERETINQLTNRLATIATNRLVMLASRVEGQISFDVRSLQEYMAAAKIVGSDQHLMMDRLRRIAASAHWRHVFRIAASKIFSITEMGHLRADVVAICDALDMGDIDKTAPFVGAGASLALDLLADGIGVKAPKYYRTLFARAVALLDREEELFDSRLTEVALADQGKILLEEIERRLNGGDFVSRQNSLNALLHIQHFEKSQALLEKFLNLEPSQALQLFSTIDLTMLPKRYRDQLKELQKRAGEEAWSAFYRSPNTADREVNQTFQDCFYHAELFRGTNYLTSRNFHVKITRETSTSIPALESHLELYRGLETDLDPAAWPIVDAARMFSCDPSPATLGSYIERVSRSNVKSVSSARYDLPWPLMAVNQDLREGANAAEMIKHAEEGAFGDLNCWLAAERRWRNAPLQATDFLAWNDGYYLGPNLDVTGPPPLTRYSRRHGGQTVDVANLLAAARQLEPRPKREKLLWLIAGEMRPSRSLESENSLSDWLEIFFEDGWDELPLTTRRARVLSLPQPVWNDPRVAELAQRYGLAGKIVRVRANDLIEAFNARPNLRGLLALFRPSISLSGQTNPLRSPVPEAFAYMDGDPQPVRAGVTLMRIRFDQLRDLELEQASVDLVSGETRIYEAARLLKQRDTGDGVRQEFAYHLARRLRIAGSELSGGLLDILKANVSAAPTRVSDNEVAKSLRLPCLV